MSEHDQGDHESHAGDADRVEILTDQGVDDAPMYANQASDSKFPSWLIWIGAIIVVNVLSAVFNWGFWLY